MKRRKERERPATRAPGVKGGGKANAADGAPRAPGVRDGGTANAAHRALRAPGAKSGGTAIAPAKSGGPRTATVRRLNDSETLLEPADEGTAAGALARPLDAA